MQTTFAEIDFLTTDRLNRVHENPKIPPIYKSLAGFEVFDTKTHEQQTTGVRNRIDRFRTDRDNLIRELRQRNVIPLAVIPTKLWNRICQETGLFRFAPDQNGNVRANRSDARYFWVAGTVLAWFLWLLPIVATIYVMTQMNWDHYHWRTPNRWMVALLIAELITYLVMAISHKPYAWSRKWLAKNLTRLVFDWGPHAWVMGRLFPNMTEVSWTKATATQGGDVVSAKLILPRLPAEIATILERVTAVHSLQVAVVPDAFRLEQKPSDLFADVYTRNARKQVEGVQRFWERVLADPIIYIERGEMVAIVAQFGDFPIEREAVEKAMTGEDCLL